MGVYDVGTYSVAYGSKRHVQVFLPHTVRNGTLVAIEGEKVGFIRELGQYKVGIVDNSVKSGSPAMINGGERGYVQVSGAVTKILTKGIVTSGHYLKPALNCDKLVDDGASRTIYSVGIATSSDSAGTTGYVSGFIFDQEVDNQSADWLPLHQSGYESAIDVAGTTITLDQPYPDSTSYKVNILFAIDDEGIDVGATATPVTGSTFTLVPNADDTNILWEAYAIA